MEQRAGLAPYLQAAPLALVFALFFLLPLALVVVVSFWDYTEYSIIPAFTWQNYDDIFDGCVEDLPDLCLTFKTYLSTLWFCVIRMISWIPLLGRNGLINDALLATGLAGERQEWLLYSEFSVVLAFVHLYTLFMIVPIFNSMMRIDRSLLEAAYDGGASAWQTLWTVIVPLCRPGIAIGSIFVITIVMGDFITIGVMGGQQIASIGKIIQVETSYLQFPAAAANAVILLAVVLLIIYGLGRIVDVRKEL